MIAVYKQVTVLAETTKALLVMYDEEGAECWLPKSHVYGASEAKHPGDEGNIYVTEWIAIKKGWIPDPDDDYRDLEGEDAFFW